MNLAELINRRQLLVATAATGLAASLGASPDEPKPSQPPGARPEDVGSIESIIRALYDVISGSKGQRRDWMRMRGLFDPSARMIHVPPRTAAGKVTPRMLTVEDYIARAGPSLERDGFFESEITRRVEKFGHIAQVFSSYESRHEKEAAPFARGINSFQLFWDESRWWVLTILWDSETPQNQLPPEFRTKS